MEGYSFDLLLKSFRMCVIVLETSLNSEVTEEGVFCFQEEWGGRIVW